MTYIPGSGGGSGSVSTSTDVALNNPQNNDALLYSSSIQKWVNGAVSGNSTIKIAGKSTSYTLALADAGTYLRMNLPSAGSLIVPTDAEVNFPIGTEVRVSQQGFGQITVTPTVPAGSVTLNVSRDWDTTDDLTNPARTSFDIPMPDGIKDGDTICLVAAIADSAVNWGVPAGFEQRSSNIGPSGLVQTLFIAKNVKAADFPIGSTRTFTSGLATALPCCAVIAAFSGAHPINPIDILAPAGADSTNTLTAPAATTNSAKVLEVSICAMGSGTTANLRVTPPTGITAIQDVSSNTTDKNISIGMSYVTTAFASSGSAIGNRTWTGSGTNKSAMTLGLKPAGTAAINSFEYTYRTAGRGASFVLTKVGANEWDVDGLLIP